MRDHKSLFAWQRARTVAHDAMRIADHHWSPPASAVIHQLQAASLSVQLNIAEGHAKGSRRAFHYHLNVAYGSAIEVIELLETIRDCELVPTSVVEGTIAVAVESRALLLGLLHKYRPKPFTRPE